MKVRIRRNRIRTTRAPKRKFTTSAESPTAKTSTVQEMPTSNALTWGLNQTVSTTSAEANINQTIFTKSKVKVFGEYLVKDLSTEEVERLYWRTALVGGGAGLVVSLLVSLIACCIIKRSFTLNRPREKYIDCEDPGQEMTSFHKSIEPPVNAVESKPAVARVEGTARVRNRVSIFENQYEEEYVRMDGDPSQNSHDYRSKPLSSNSIPERLEETKAQPIGEGTKQRETNFCTCKVGRESNVYDEPNCATCKSTGGSGSVYYSMARSPHVPNYLGIACPRASFIKSEQVGSEGYENVGFNMVMEKTSDGVPMRWHRQRNRSMPCISLIAQSPCYEEMWFRPLNE